MLEACRAVAATVPSSSLVGQGIRRLVGQAVSGGHGAPSASSVRRLEGRHRPARAVVRRDVRPAGRRSPGAATCTAAVTSTGAESCRARSGRCSRTSGRSSGPTARSSATTSTSMTLPTASSDARRRRPASVPTLRGEAFNFAGRDRLTVLEVVERILELMGIRPRTRRPWPGPDRDPGAARRDSKAQRVLGWRAAGHLRRRAGGERSIGIARTWRR